MDWILIGKALVLGLVEGVTEFLPISSTGHLILAGSLLNFQIEGAKTFHIVIQFGAILAVCWEYRRRIGAVTTGLVGDRASQRFALNVVVATIPAVLLGFMLEAAIKRVLYAPVPVAFALVAGGFVLLWADARQRARGETPARVRSVDQLTPLDALKVGLAQCVALIPGVSRSGATIVGALFVGVDRRVATEFSFFLAIPIICGATAYELMKAGGLSTLDLAGLFTVGTLAAFVSAFVCVRWLLRYIATHDFSVFAWYRIAFGMIVLILGYGADLGWGA